MSKPSRESLFKKLNELNSYRDDLSSEVIELIFTSRGHETGKHASEEALFRMAHEIKILRIKYKLGYVQ